MTGAGAGAFGDIDVDVDGDDADVVDDGGSDVDDLGEGAPPPLLHGSQHALLTLAGPPVLRHELLPSLLQVLVARCRVPPPSSADLTVLEPAPT